MGNSRGSRANNIYSPGIDKLTEVSALCQPESRVIRASSDAEKPFFLFSDFAVKAANSENKKNFSTTEKPGK